MVIIKEGKYHFQFRKAKLPAIDPSKASYSISQLIKWFTDYGVEYHLDQDNAVWQVENILDSIDLLIPELEKIREYGKKNGCLRAHR